MSLHEYTLGTIETLKEAAKKQGLRVFQAANGTETWGLITNQDGSKCLSFGSSWFGGLYLSTCYKSKPGFKEGCGRRITDITHDFDLIEGRTLTGWLESQEETDKTIPVTLEYELTRYESSQYKEV